MDTKKSMMDQPLPLGQLLKEKKIEDFINKNTMQANPIYQLGKLGESYNNIIDRLNSPTASVILKNFVPGLSSISAAGDHKTDIDNKDYNSALIDAASILPYVRAFKNPASSFLLKGDDRLIANAKAKMEHYIKTYLTDTNINLYSDIVNDNAVRSK